MSRKVLELLEASPSWSLFVFVGKTELLFVKPEEETIFVSHFQHMMSLFILTFCSLLVLLIQVYSAMRL